MGYVLDPRSTSTPVDITAEPSLIPGLITRMPWPRWVLVIIILAAGVLLVSCLLCVIYCCCRRRQRRRKQPRNKEAVGLGSPCSSINTHLVQPDVGCLEPCSGGPRQWGRLLLSLEYDFGSQEIRVGLRQAENLKAEGTADPYARISVSNEAGRRYETKVYRGTLCPVFAETCCFLVPPAELPRTTLKVQLLDFKRFSEHEPLGELQLSLGTVDPQHVLESWYQLGPPGTTEPEQIGELCFSLRYVPSSGRLTVVVLEARGLNPGLVEPYVKVQLMLKQRKWKKKKTSCKKGTITPYFNEAFTFLVPFSQIQSVDLVLAVWDHGLQLRAEPVGKVLLGPRASGQPLQHWADMLAHARRPIAQWHHLQSPRKVDHALALKPRLPLPRPRYLKNPSFPQMELPAAQTLGEAWPIFLKLENRALLKLAHRRIFLSRDLGVWGLLPTALSGGFHRSGIEKQQKRNRAITARRQHLKSVMLQIAATELEKEESRRESEKQNYLSEHCPPLHIPGSMSEVQELCKQLHAKIDVAEEEKYDMEVKVQKSSKELEDMNQKLFDLRGKFKRPPLRRVRMSADAMLKALLGSKHKVCMDLRANLKQVKKEDTEKERDLRDVGDWRKNIEEKSGMEGRKKMFESES
ncbi:synaptotagmin-8 isoform X2 [Sigmodon hispidus]